MAVDGAEGGRGGEAILSEAEASLIRTMPVAVIVRDGEGRIVLANERTAELVGLSLREIQAMKVEEPGWHTLHGDGSPMLRKDFPPMMALAAGKPVLDTVMGFFIPSRNVTRWAVVNSVPEFRRGEDRPYRVISTLTDITELKDTRNRLAVTLHSLADGVVATDSGGLVTLMNPVAERLCGLEAADALGRPFSEVCRLEDEGGGKPLGDPLRAQPASSKGRRALLSGKGEGRRPVVIAVGLMESEGGPAGTVVIIHDATEERRLEDQMAKSQRLESLGTLAGGIAHDFNNLLGGVFGYIDLAQASVKAGDAGKAEAYLASASEIFERARSLTRQLLTFARGGAPERKQSDLGYFVREQTTFALSGSPIRAVFEIPEGDWSCEFDDKQLSQVIEAIVLNAKDAMPSGGSLSVRIARLDLEEGAFPGARRGCYARIVFRDSGPGVPPQARERIFDPFFSTKEGKSGLGLAAAYSIMARHSGFIELDPQEEGAGASFSLFLPASPREAPSAAEEGATAAPGRKILFMDDEDYLRQIAQLMFEAAGCEVETAADGREALTLVKAAVDCGQPFSFAVMDLTVPGGLGGQEALRLMPDADPDLPVVATSGYSEDPVIADPVGHGFAASLRKPFRQAEVAELVARIRPRGR